MLTFKVKGLRPEALGTRGNEAKYRKKHKNQSSSLQEQCEEQISWAESKIFSAWLSKISTFINIMGSSGKPQHPCKAIQLNTSVWSGKFYVRIIQWQIHKVYFRESKSWEVSEGTCAVIFICSLQICKLQNLIFTKVCLLLQFSEC